MNDRPEPSGCTINGEPAVVIRIADLNDLTARLHQAEAATRPEPAAILAVVETALNDQLIDTARAEALDGIRRVLGQAVDPADDEPAPCKTCGEPWHKRHTCAARTTPDNPPTSSSAADNYRPVVGLARGGRYDEQQLKAAMEPDNPAVAAPATPDDGLRDRIAAALIRAGFGEQDASDAAGVALAVVEPRFADLHADRTDAMNDQDRLRAAIRHAAACIGIAAIKAPDDLKPRLLAISGGLREAVEPEATP